MKTAILGFGREGKSLYDFFKNKNPKEEIVVLDKKLDPNYLDHLKEFKLVFRSPGVPFNLPEIKQAIKKGVKFSSATKLFFETLKKTKKGKIIGITGTKGKGTTSQLLFNILKNAKKDVVLAGNIGTSVMDVLVKVKKNTIVILELSSFQLQDLDISPEIAVVLDIFPDHLDSHKDMKEYLEAKSQVVLHQKKGGITFFNADNKLATEIGKKSKVKKIAVSEKDFNLFKTNDLRIAGPHNFKNVVMASRIAEYLGIKPEIIKKSALEYEGLPYRLELVKTLKSQNGIIEIYNDSASTNPETSASAIKAFNNPIFLIMGGKDKNLNYKSVAEALKKSSVEEIVLFGENKNKIKESIKDLKIETNLAPDLMTAFGIIYRSAQRFIKLGKGKEVAIVFSPGATSFDMFKDYPDRGRAFNELVREL